MGEAVSALEKLTSVWGATLEMESHAGRINIFYEADPRLLPLLSSRSPNIDRQDGYSFPLEKLIFPRDFWHFGMLTLEISDMWGSPSKVAGSDSDPGWQLQQRGPMNLGDEAPHFTGRGTQSQGRQACTREHGKEVRHLLLHIVQVLVSWKTEML